MPGDTAVCLRPRAAGLRQVAGPDRGTVIERVKTGRGERAQTVEDVARVTAATVPRRARS